MADLLFILCLVTMVNYTVGCSCVPMPRRKKVCQTDYVVEVRVMSDLINENGQDDFDEYYHINVMSNIKMPNVTGLDLARVYTATHDALCGVYLRNNTDYVIGGKITENGPSSRRMNIELCRSVLTKRKRNGRLPNYLRNTKKCKKS